MSEEKLINFINNNDKRVVDLCYSISPEECKNLNAVTLFLGFLTISDATLQNKLEEHNAKDTNVKEIKSRCREMQKRCKSVGIPFIDINRDRNEVLKEAFHLVKSKYKEN